MKKLIEEFKSEFKKEVGNEFIKVWKEFQRNFHLEWRKFKMFTFGK